jgi:hypothetical protein
MLDGRRSIDGRSTLPELTTRSSFRERSIPSSARHGIPAGKDHSYASSRSAPQESLSDLDFAQSMRFWCDTTEREVNPPIL